MNALRRFAVSACALVAVLSLVVAAPAPANASEEQAKQNLFATIKVIREKYPNLRDRREYGTGTLEAGKSQVYREHFDAGVTYVIIAVGCDGASDLDVGIGDKDGNLLESDTQDDASPVVIFTPDNSGDYIAVVKMAKTTTSDAAHFAYQVFYVDQEH
jgi:hypothetical protein